MEMESEGRKQFRKGEIRNNSKYLKEETWIKGDAANKLIYGFIDLQKKGTYKRH